MSAASSLSAIAQKEGNSISQVEQEDSYQTDRYEQERLTDDYHEDFTD